MAKRKRLTPAPAPLPAATLDPPADGVAIAAGVWMQVAVGLQRPKYTMSGPNVDAGFRARLEDWLRR